MHQSTYLHKIDILLIFGFSFKNIIVVHGAFQHNRFSERVQINRDYFKDILSILPLNI